MLATTAEHDLAVAVTKHRIGTRVTVRGEVDLLTSPELSATLDRVTAGSTSEVEVDLSGVRFFGCSGAAVLARAAGRARRRGGRLTVLDAPRLVQVVLRAARLDRLLNDRQAWSA